MTEYLLSQLFFLLQIKQIWACNKKIQGLNLKILSNLNEMVNILSRFVLLVLQLDVGSVLNFILSDGFRLKLETNIFISVYQLDLAISYIQELDMRASAKIYTPEQIHSISYSPSLKSHFVVKDFTLENRIYSEIQFQLIDDLEESFPNKFFLAVIDTLRERHETNVGKDQMKKGQVLQKSQTYLLIKVPPKYGFREKIEVGLPSLRQQNDIDLFEIKVRNGRQNLIFYTLKCIKIDQLRKKTVSKLHLMEDKIYQNIYQLMKNIEYLHPSTKQAVVIRQHNLVWGQEKCYYIQNREELNRVKSQSINKSNLNNILGIMKLLIIQNQNRDDKDQSLEIPIQDIRKYEQKKFQFTGKYQNKFLRIWKNCIKYIKIMHYPNNQLQLASEFMQLAQHLYSLAKLQLRTLIFTEYKANTIQFLDYDPLEPWTERELLRHYEDLKPEIEKQYCKLLPKQNNEQVLLSDQSIDQFLVKEKTQIKSYKFFKENKIDIINYIKNTERIIWTKILQNKQKPNQYKRISQIIQSYRKFENLRELALIQCNISSMPNLYSINSNDQEQKQIGLFGLRSLRGLFLDRNKIKMLSAQDKGDVYGSLELLSVNQNPIKIIDLDYLQNLRLLRLKQISLLSLKDKNKSVLKPIIQCVLPLPQQFIGYQQNISRIKPERYQIFSHQAKQIYKTAIKLILSGWNLFYRVDAFGGEAKEQKQYYSFISSPNWRYELDNLQKILQNQKKKQLEGEELSEYNSQLHQYQQPELKQELRLKKRYQYLQNQGHYAHVGGRVFFPHKKAYKCQIQTMEFIYKNLEKNPSNSMLIQSQTGTGKTLSILASVLGWVHNDNQKKRQILKKREKQREKVGYIKWGELDRTKNQPINKIIYMSRSHTQLEQVSQQLARTSYRPDVVVVGSRLKLCAHQTVSQIPELDKLNKGCQHAIEATKELEKLKKMTVQQKLLSQLWSDEQKLKKKYEELQKQMCKYYKAFDTRREINKQVFQLLSGKPVKIEDEKKAAKFYQTCPYFYPSSGKFFANLILMPYIYLLDHDLLKTNQSYIPNSIIIFDEGHNILNEAEEGASLIIKENFFKHVLKDLERIFKDNPKEALRLDQDKLSFDPDQYERLKIQEEFSKQKLIGSIKIQPTEKLERRQPKLKREEEPLKVLKQLEENFTKYREIKIKQMERKFYQENNKRSMIPNQQQGGQGYEPEEFDSQQQQQKKFLKSERIEFIRSQQIKSEIIRAFVGPLQLTSNVEIDIEINELFRKLTGIQSYLAKIQSNQGNTKIYMTSWTKFFARILHFQQILKSETLDPDYGLYLHSVWRGKEEETQQKQKNIEVKKNKQQPKQLSQKRSLYMKLRCFNSSIMFEKIQSLKPKSVIIASGTLFPPKEWFPYTSLDFQRGKFPFDEFDKQQIMTVNISKHQGSPLRLITKNFPYKLKLALDTIQIICKSTPQGVLVIFPSKRWVIGAKKIIGTSTVGGKTVKFENKKQTANLEQFVENYQKQCLSQKGAVIFAFCRGSLSEGINFKNQLCRAVVMIGVPLQPYKNPYIVGKSQYCNKKHKIDIKKGSPEKYIHQSASQWSKHEVAKTISQGIGRVIRTIQDYGVIYLVDERYNKNNKQFNLDHISQWAIQDQVFKNNRDTNQIEQLSKQFFDKQQKRLKKQEKEKAEKLKQQLESSII